MSKFPSQSESPGRSSRSLPGRSLWQTSCVVIGKSYPFLVWLSLGMAAAYSYSHVAQDSIRINALGDPQPQSPSQALSPSLSNSSNSNETFNETELLAPSRSSFN